eukprot:447188-Prorocentrum_minimum.AAC.1
MFPPLLTPSPPPPPGGRGGQQGRGQRRAPARQLPRGELGGGGDQMAGKHQAQGEADPLRLLRRRGERRPRLRPVRA